MSELRSHIQKVCGCKVDLYIENATISGNKVEEEISGAGIYSDGEGGGSVSLVNSIVYFNRCEDEFNINCNLNGDSMELLEEYNVIYTREYGITCCILQTMLPKYETWYRITAGITKIMGPQIINENRNFFAVFRWQLAFNFI